MLIHVHDFAGGKGCVHCRALDPASICVGREVDDAPTGPRVKAVNDFDAIASRVHELAAQRAADEAAMARAAGAAGAAGAADPEA